VPRPNISDYYDVFDSGGRWLTTVHLPGELGTVKEIGEDYVLTIWYDELRVPYLRMCRLEKAGP
jgi:hypothetical protein